MKQDFQYNRVVAPMAEMWNLWQREGVVTVPWFFEILQGLIEPKPLLYSVVLDSPFFHALNEEFQKRNLYPEYIVEADDLFGLDSLPKLIKSGLGFSLLFFKPLGPEWIEKIKEMEDFSFHDPKSNKNLKGGDSLKFIILARKDWPVENTYRSIPHFMRSRLYMDFPISLSLEDPFYSIDEWTPLVRSMEKQFPGFQIKSHCPNLGFHAEVSNPNLSHFSLLHEKTSKNPFLSVILTDPNPFEAITRLKKMAQNQDQMEFVFASIAKEEKANLQAYPPNRERAFNQPSHIYEKDSEQFTFHPPSQSIQTEKNFREGFLDQEKNENSISFVHYQVHPKNREKPVSKPLVNNFLAGKARGQYLWFPDLQTPEDSKAILNTLFEGSFDELQLLNQKKVMVFHREDFLKMGGFDPLFTERPLSWVDSTLRYGIFKNRDKDSVKSMVLPETAKLSKSFESQRIMIFHKYAGEKKIKWKNQVSNNHHKVEKRYIKMIFKPLLVRSGLHRRYENRWIKLYYRVKYLVFYNRYSRKWSYRFHKAYWRVFYILYPIRKIYYFCHFQYEKRILGLHLKNEEQSLKKKQNQ